MAILRLLPLLLVTACTPLTHYPTDKTDKQYQADGRITLGMRYLQLGQLDKAGQNIESALAHAPNYYRAQLAQAIYFQHSGLHDLARKQYQTLLDHSAEQSDVLLSYATFLCQQKQFKQASLWFERSIHHSTASQRVTNYQNAALCASKSGNYSQAKQYLVLALEHQPNRLDLRVYLVRNAIQQGQLEEAKMQLMALEARSSDRATTQALWREWHLSTTPTP
ncbi:tetratricopeptide repeat protein [Vibrio sp. JPW-9-11-11]|uniref:tetratricopeptide repeat protein n=1 Tax=Vibrio sp. JPW-9-11-11 TaxID=1416532 RepID=UPI001593BA26|nr:tetratricopeptide repeat protein [Vibrio sp. JPW-9-11-11]NVD06580.1 tetratricopeptide repeat protein [Vibrio sp. JPW-9-11-11]